MPGTHDHFSFNGVHFFSVVSWTLALKGAYLNCNWSLSDFSESFVFWKLFWQVTFRCSFSYMKWAASSEFGTYRLCEQRRFRRACASAQSRQNLHCSLIQAVNQEEPSDRKPDPWPLWMTGHAQLKFVMTECSKTQIRLTGLKWYCAVIGNQKPRKHCLNSRILS